VRCLELSSRIPCFSGICPSPGIQNSAQNVACTAPLLSLEDRNIRLPKRREDSGKGYPRTGLEGTEGVYGVTLLFV
jgi:hypothetical protein